MLVAGVDASAEPLSADRPGQANPPTIVEPGVLQLEGGVTLQGNGGAEPVDVPGRTDDGGQLDVPELEMRLGVHPRVELQLQFDGFSYRWSDGESDASGATDLGIDARVYLWDQSRWRPESAVQLGLSIPTGADALTSDGFDPSLNLLYQWGLTRRVSLNGNFVFGAPSRGTDTSGRYFEFEPSLALGISLAERVGTFVEYYGSIRTEGLDDNHGFDGGFTWLATENLQLDVNGGLGLSGSKPGFFAGLGAAWRLPPLWT